MLLDQLLLALPSLSSEQIAPQFDKIADQTLLRSQLVVFGRRCRLLEMEFYYFSDVHPDPFTHCHEIQAQFGRWYFHRVGKGYRNGSFKGLDFTFGRASDDSGSITYGGVLIRSLATDTGEVVCGPSLCVDFLIGCSECDSVSALDGQVGQHKIWEKKNPVRFDSCDQHQLTIYKSWRVGLSDNIDEDSQPKDYAQREYRYLVQPRDIKKGRPLAIQGMYRSGHTPEQIRELTGSPRKSIVKHIAALNAEA